MAKQGTLLVVDDNRNILTSLQYLLEEYFQQVITLNSPVPFPPATGSSGRSTARHEFLFRH